MVEKNHVLYTNQPQSQLLFYNCWNSATQQGWISSLIYVLQFKTHPVNYLCWNYAAQQ